MTAERIELGPSLFSDARLSLDGAVACASCHERSLAFANGQATAPGAHDDQRRM